MKRFVFDYDGIDCPSQKNGITVYPNDGDEPRIIMADDYDFRYSLLLVFGGEGLLYELGSDLLANKDGKLGSPQTSVRVPAGGFLVACGYNACAEMIECFNTATEGAMLYNATRIATFEMFGMLDRVKGKLTVYYDEPKKVSENADKYLFVGNSGTYFQGTPLLFRNLCRAAGVEVDVDYCTFGAAYLSEFANPEHERGKALRAALKAKSYDYVILHDASAATYEQSKEALSVIMPLIEKNGGDAVLYLRYSASSGENMEEVTHRHYEDYTALAEDFDLELMPSGLTFPLCRKSHPEIPLYADDSAHHSAEAAYMIACTWLCCLTGISPVGNTFDPHFDPETTLALQKCAYTVCKKLCDKKKTADILKKIGIGAAVVGAVATAFALLFKKSDRGEQEK